VRVASVASSSKHQASATEASMTKPLTGGLPRSSPSLSGHRESGLG
jgi:hypothetical protein